LTVADSNAIDAPQTVTVTVRIGTVSVDVAPGGSRDVDFKTSSLVNSTVTPKDDWLQVVLLGAGSFRFDYPYRIAFHPSASTPQGNYNGSVALSGGSNPQDNQTVPVLMRVTSQPIGAPSTDRLVVRLAEGSPALQYPFSPFVSLNNAGQGPLTVSDTSVSGGNRSEE